MMDQLRHSTLAVVLASTAILFSLTAATASKLYEGSAVEIITEENIIPFFGRVPKDPGFVLVEFCKLSTPWPVYVRNR